jgi:hypothetical protein
MMTDDQLTGLLFVREESVRPRNALRSRTQFPKHEIPMMPSMIRFGLTLGLACLAAPAFGDVKVVERPPTTPVNAHYVTNRPPLLPNPLVRLPVGAVRPEGWLRKQLELQAAGFHGHLAEISDFLKMEKNAWLSPTGDGQRGWEEVPYWLKGFGDCAYLLNNAEQIKQAQVWINGAINSQRDDGFFGPRGKGATATVESTKGKYDLWPNMVMLNCLQSYYEFSKDPRVIKLMTKYFEWELRVPEDDFLPPYWQQQRAADNLASVYWLYNRTGEPWLLDLAAKIHKHTADWSHTIPSWHNVNIAQGFGGPATYYPQAKDRSLLDAAYRNYLTVREKYGQVPGGMFGGDETCRPGYTDPRQAIETCGMVEMMLSCERLLTITGDPLWADRCEDVAFNALPAATTADMKALRYLTAPNMAASDRRSHAPGIENGGPMFRMDPHDHRCCQHNMGHGWPYLAESLWMATAGNGLAAVLYAESKVTAIVGDGVEVVVSEKTHYPFPDAIEFVVSAPRPVGFPLYLRIPGWCQNPVLSVNKEQVPGIAAKPGTYLAIDRTWKDGDEVRFVLPEEVRFHTYEKNHNSVSVALGPLTYALKIGEKYVRSGGTDAWPAWEILPTTPWNYALVLQPRDHPVNYVTLDKTWPRSNMPWTLEGTPTEIEVKVKRVAQWQLDRFGLVAPLQDSPVKTDEPVETITLIPMGAARLRISAFPVAGNGPDAHTWVGLPPLLPYTMTASHCFENDTLTALGDQLGPRSSNDHSIPRMTWWDHKGTNEWVQYDFGKPKRVSKIAVYWFDDLPGGGCALPASYRLAYRDGGEWKPVATVTADPIAKDRYNRISFTPVDTSALRLEVVLQPGRSGGILEWKVE